MIKEEKNYHEDHERHEEKNARSEGIMIKTAIYGITGKMGSMVLENLAKNPEFEIVGGVSTEHIGENVRDVFRIDGIDAVIYGGIKELMEKQSFDLLVDFSRAECAFSAIRKALKTGKKIVSGTTGFTDEEITILKNDVEKYSSSLLIAPNFCIGAVLMMKFAQTAAKHFSGCEIIELHHTQKADSPSGTARLTAEKIAEASKISAYQIEKGTEFRGGDASGIRVHSIRLPGMLAHQEVIFGNDGEVFRLRHDSSDRNSFMNGIYKAIEKVIADTGFIYGIESLI